MQLTQHADTEFAKTVTNSTDNHKQGAFHNCVVDNVQNRTYQAIEVAYCQTYCNVTDLSHTGVRQHSAEVILCNCHNRTQNDCNGTKCTYD